ncbi:hypothetical protein O181_012203 [Austropuccinia psidii MF-1]|uniref:Zinc-finger domain-containing protein n=1 Tax=Austropuccinia psidii MF-1 TaxID=1389203 RepID=A0A9Q3BWC4_9BASI|nr:hypothetical protein [Austropuccinia psidii MF-1]
MPRQTHHQRHSFPQAHHLSKSKLTSKSKSAVKTVKQANLTSPSSSVSTFHQDQETPHHRPKKNVKSNPSFRRGSLPAALMGLNQKSKKSIQQQPSATSHQNSSQNLKSLPKTEDTTRKRANTNPDLASTQKVIKKLKTDNLKLSQNLAKAIKKSKSDFDIKLNQDQDQNQKQDQNKPQEPIKSQPSKKSSAEPDNQISTKSVVSCRNGFCEKCLLHRYGEELPKLRLQLKTSNSWNCPVCKDDCNCSYCRRKKGLEPTGRLTKIANEGGYASVRQLLLADPHAQGPEMIALTNRLKDASKSTQTNELSPKTKTANSHKSTFKSANPHTTVPKISPKNSLEKNNANKKNPKEQKELEVKKQKDQTAKKSQTVKPQPSDNQSPALDKGPLPKSADTSQNTSQPIQKPPFRKGPHFAPPPKPLHCLPTGHLTSEQIRLRINIREFICRFRNLLPGLGGTEQPNSKTEAQRAAKVLDSMDDVVNFWIDDEGGMRAIVNALAKLIDGDDDKDELKKSSVLESVDSSALLDQLKKDSKASTAPNPFLQGSASCWLSARKLLNKEGLGAQVVIDSKSPYIKNKPPEDERVQRLKVPPEEKLAIINGLVDLALRGPTLADDLLQGLEREKQARADIFKERAKLNKKWLETKAQKLALMPSKESLLPTDGATPSSSQLAEESARAQAMTEWEADMGDAEDEHKKELLISQINQYIIGSLDRLRFQSIGQDTRRNSYYILSGTPGRLYPSDQLELAYAWSYNLIMHGSHPHQNKVNKKKSEGSKEALKKKENRIELGKEDEELVSYIETNRELDDRWIRISHPKDIKQLAGWIEYEAKLLDFQQDIKGLKQNNNNKNVAQGPKGLDESNNDTIEQGKLMKNLKSVTGLIEQIQRFGEYLELKINEKEELSTDRRRVSLRKN